MAERLLIRGLTKSFGGTVVLRDADMRVEPGEVHGLIGQNGSGKSTLVKLLSGFLVPDRGEVFVDGEELRMPPSPTQLQQFGVAFVHQDFGLVPTLSVTENVRVGRFSVGRFSRRVNWRRERQAVRRTFERLSVDIALDTPVRLLSTAQRAVLALARALQGYEPGRGCIILDEATQALPRETLPEFYSMIREFSSEGTAFIVVSHRLDEIMRMTDHVTVLRDGVVVAPSLEISKTSPHALASAMLGASLETVDMKASYPEHAGALAAEFTGLSGRIVNDVSFAVRAGEVLGVTGLTDSGVGELPYVISGATRAARGVVRLASGVELDLSSDTVGELLAEDVLLVPADRIGAGLALSISAVDNLTLSTLGSYRGAWVSRRRQRAAFDAMVGELDIRPRRPDLAVARYSGGNQQKVLLGKCLLHEPSLLVLHEPTQAVDVGARHDLLVSLRRRAQAGAAIVIASVEHEDLAQVCDRVLVLGGGRIRCELVDDLRAETIAARIWEAGTSMQEPSVVP
jgi:ribose transport system ATP-binding protein